MVPTSASDELIGDLEWVGNGVELSIKASRTKAEHLERFKDGLIVKVIQVGMKFIIFDYYAGIYLYEDGLLIANCHLNISSIDSVVVSRTRRWLAVGSKVDRNIVLFELSELIQ